MKKYIDPQIEIVCLNSADVITASGDTPTGFTTGGTANFGSTTYKIDVEDGFWN